MPGDLSGVRIPSASPIYFLEEARPAFAEGATQRALSDAGVFRYAALPPIAGDAPNNSVIPGVTAVPLGGGSSDLALPSEPQPVPGVTSAPSTTPAPIPGTGEETISDQSVFSFLDVRSAFAEPEAALDPKEFSEFLQPPTPTVPGELRAVESFLPGFSFMEEARPIFSYPPTVPGPVPTTGDSPTNAPASGAAKPEPEPFVLKLSTQEFDAHAIRRDFPILQERVNGRPLVWLDNAATTQKPQSVIDRLSYFYAHENSNVHRAAHELAARATDAYEAAREKVRRFLNAPSAREIIFVRGTTEGINLVAQSWGRQNVHEGDEIVITWLEHHANIVPWQMLCSETGARLRVAPVDDTGQVILEEYEKLLGPRTRLVAVAQVSNALGTITPVDAIIEAAHRHGARVLVDGAQAVSHMPVDVQALNCDFYVLSGHKMFAPTGIGAVFGKSEILDVTQPWQGGGSMIVDVTFDKTVYSAPPQRFEAGTGNIADAVGLGAAIDYLERVGMPNVSRHEHALLEYGTERLREVPGLRIIGTAREKAGVLSFIIDGVPNQEIADYLNRDGIAVRAGHHCAQPIHRRFGLESSVRASLALYNTREDLDALASALQRLQVSRRNGAHNPR
jgi:cysteine desulfurase / selenocysteine lyase